MLKKLDIIAEKSFIAGWFIDTKVCDELIDHFETSPFKQAGKTGSGDQESIKPLVKDSIDLLLDISVSVVKNYDAQLLLAVNEYIQEYPDSNNIAPWCVHSANIQKYNPKGGYFKWHTERCSAEYPSSTRHLVFMTYLNDVTDAGETEFRNQKLKVKPQKGLTLIWPADWTHTHRGIASPSQTKYIATGWFNFIR